MKKMYQILFLLCMTISLQASSEDSSTECRGLHESAIDMNKQVMMIVNDPHFDDFNEDNLPEGVSLQAYRVAKADRQMLKMARDTQPCQEDVETILSAFSYLNSEELQLQLRMEEVGSELISDSFRRWKSEEEALKRKKEQEQAPGVIDSRSLVDRMISRGCFSESAQNRLKAYRELSLFDIENKLTEVGLSLDEVEDRFNDDVVEDTVFGCRKFYNKVLIEIYASKKRDDLLMTYKDYSLQEMCDEINDLSRVVSMPKSGLLSKIYRDVMVMKMKAEMAKFAAQHGGELDINAFIESQKELESRKVSAAKDARAI